MTRKPAKQGLCECSDRQCPAHKDYSCAHRHGKRGQSVLYRVDMTDETGTLFCSDCADDAMESGLFTYDATETREVRP